MDIIDFNDASKISVCDRQTLGN